MKLQSKFLVLFVCALLCFCNGYKVQAATNTNENQNTADPVVIVKDQLVITIKYGFSQEARYGRYLSYYVDIYNKGEAINGVIKATLLNNGQENVTYAKSQLLPADEKTQVMLQLPMNRYTQEVHFSLESKDGKTIVEETMPLDIKNYGNSCIIGVLSDNPMLLSYLQYFGNEVVFLNKDNLSADYLSYDILDTIVVDNFDLDSLESDKINSLIRFVEKGGNLVLGINEDNLSNIELLEQYNVLKTDHELSYKAKDNQLMKFSLYSDSEFTRMQTTIRDYESSRNSLLKDIEDSKVEFSCAGEDTFIGKPMLGSIPVTDLTQKKVSKQVSMFTLANSENIIEQDNKRLYEQVSYGHGNILVFHFGIQNNEITEDKLALYDGCSDALFSPFYAEISYQIKMNLSSFTKNRLEKEITGECVDYGIRDMSEYSEIANIPKVGCFIFILVIYILILGPVSFFVLWKLKRQSKLWMVIPSVSIIFFVIVYIAGTKTRIKAPYAGYLNIEYYDNALPDVEGSTYAFVGLSQRDSNKIKFKNVDALMVGDNDYPGYYSGIYKEKSKEHKFYDYTDDAMSVLYKDDQVSAQFYDRAAFNTELFRVNYHKTQNPLFISDLSLTKKSLDGTVTNCSDQTLKYTLLYLCGHYINLGTMTPGQTVKLSDCIAIHSDDIESLIYTDNDIKTAWNLDADKLSTTQMRKLNAYAYAYQQYMFQSMSPCIIASLDNVSSESPLYDVVKGEASYGESVIVAKLELNNSSDEEVIIPNIDCYLADSSTYTWHENTRFSYVNSIDFVYNIPKTDHVKELFLSDLFNKFGDEDYGTTNCGKIYFYNYTTDKYDLIFDLYSKYGTRNIQGNELEKYLNEDNRITIRYEGSNTTTSDGFVVPVISCRKETINADN